MGEAGKDEAGQRTEGGGRCMESGTSSRSSNAGRYKQMAEIAAEAEAERIRRHARGEADAIYLKLEAEARGINEMLMKQAEGFKAIVEATGSAEAAMKLMIVDKLPELIEKQVEAIKNIKIDKVTVWDNLGGDDGKTNTAKFVSGMMQSVPPLNELFNMAGLDIPTYLGKPSSKEPTNAMIEE